MKKSSRVILVLLTLLCMAFGFAACGENINSIEVGTLPRVQFVQGLDLDLTGGTITVNYENKTEEVSLTAEGVSVTGYEKDKLGEQTLTVTYKEFTTELKVTVVERMVVSGATTDYFVGDEFDTSKGQLTVRADNATSSKVKLSNKDVSVTGFNSEEAGEKTVTLSYGGYTVAMTVTVHTPIIKPHFPKTNYETHESELVVRGGYFTLTSENGKLKKDVPMTEDMVVGYDPSQATIENTANNPLKQELTVNFMEQQFTYTVSIIYSDVSYFKAIAAEIKAQNIVWSGSTIIQESWNTSYDALCRYLEMSSKERSYLTDEEIELIVRPAVYYAWWTWSNAKKAYENTLQIQNGSIYLVAQDYETVRADYDKLALGTDDFVVIGKKMMQFSKSFGDFELVGYTVKQLVDGCYNFDTFDEVLDRIKFTLNLYECLKDIPEDWDKEDLEANSVKIDSAKRMIVSGGYSDQRSLFAIVGTWREDFYNIIYSYYYEKYVEAVEAEDETAANSCSSAIYGLMSVYLPGPLEELYSTLNDVFQQAQQLKNKPLWESTYLFLYYKELLDIVEQVEEMENDIYSVLYNQCGLKAMVYNYALNVSSDVGYGILAMSGGSYADESFTALWGKYIDLFETMFEEIKLQGMVTYADFAAKYKTNIVALYKAYVQLSPAEQIGFLSSLHSDYLKQMTEGDLPSVFEYTYASGTTIAMQQSQFVFFIAYGGFDQYLVNAPAAKATFHKLLQAMEYYARAQISEREMANFITTMEAAMEEKKNIVSASEIALYEELFKTEYEKYVALYTMVKAETNPQLSEETKAQFDNLVVAIGKVYAYYDLVKASINTSKFNTSLCGLVMGAYGKAEQLVAEILNGGNETAINAYYNLPYKVGQDQYGEDVYMTLDYFMYTARTRFVSAIAMFQVDYTPFINVYLQSSLTSLFVTINDVLIDTYLSDEVSFTADDKEAVETLMRAIWNIDQSEWYIFNAVGGAYYDGLYAYFKDVVSETAASLSEELMNVELAYRNYLTYPNGVYQDGTSTFDYFKNKFDEVEAVYTNLPTSDKEYLQVFYEHYKALAYPTENA